MAATGLQMNWTNVSFASTTLNRVDEVSFNVGGQVTGYSGDGDLFHTVKVNNMNNPTASIRSSNVSQLMGLAPGTTGTLVATNKDAKGAVGGNVTFTLVNAVVVSPNMSGSHAQFSSGTVNFEAFSTDGVTNPLSIAMA